MSAGAVKRPPVPSVPHAPVRGRGWLRASVAALIAIPVGGAYLVLRSGSETVSDSMTSYEVVRRSFPIVLEEKGTLKAATSTNIVCDIEGGGKILKLIPEGDAVQEGDFLVEFAGDKIEEKLQAERARENEAQNALVRSNTDATTHQHESTKKIRAARRTVTQAKLDLEKYTEADWPQQLADAEVALENAENELLRAEQEYEASKTLAEKGVITGPDLLKAKIVWVKAKADKAKTKLALRSLNDYTHDKDQDEKESAVHDAEEELAFVKQSAQDNTKSKLADIEAKEMALKLFQEKIKRLEEQLQKTTITAPGPGIVVYGDSDQPWQRDQIGEGKTVWKGTVVLQIPDLTVMHAVVRVHESKADQVKVGQQVEVEAEGSKDRTFKGTVMKIGALPDTQNRWLNPDVKEYETEIKLEGENLPLHPGGTAKARIFIGNVEDVLCVPLQAVFSRGRRHFVFKETGASVEPVEVTVDRSNDVYVEITSGVDQGDRIRLAVDESLVAMLPDAEDEPGARVETSTTLASANAPEVETSAKRVESEHGESETAPDDPSEPTDDTDAESSAVAEGATPLAVDTNTDEPAEG
ncbi:MAG: efflux RND transporter periplasmic adaptor subunit [Planctomycetes bacterium]|nr:efflux RND transporter periplasmic adaptor subunit [Planctomycetota bacterium]